MFASAARPGQAADSTVLNEAEASDDEDDTRSRAELQPRLSGDEVGLVESNGPESSETEEVRTMADSTQLRPSIDSCNNRANLLMKRHLRRLSPAMAPMMRNIRRMTIHILKNKTNLTENWHV